MPPATNAADASDVVLAIQMPKLDRLSVIWRIREDVVSDTPIIAVTMLSIRRGQAPTSPRQ